MPELLLLLGALLTGFLYRKYLKTKLSRAFCVIVASSFIVGHGMNILVIRLNGGQMPVIEGNQDWSSAPAIDFPVFVDELIFDKYLPRAQKIMLLTDEPHRIIPEGKESGVRLKFLADIHPIRIGGHYFLYSLGDTFIVTGLMALLIGIIPIWLVSRRIRRSRTP